MALESDEPMLHAGMKRSFQQMRDIERISSTSAGSRHDSPRSTSRGTSLDGEPHYSQFIQFDGLNDWRRQTSFSSNASIVLIGVRGVGKSSLGVLAATAYSRRLVDSERSFLDTTGATAQGFRRAHGSAEYQKMHSEILKRTLQTHQKDCVIICTLSDLEKEGANIVREYSKTHPVIHVTRETKGIQSHLTSWSEEKIKGLLTASNRALRSCANFEFFNLSEELYQDQHCERSKSKPSDTKGLNRSYLTLKRVERDFLKFLGNVIGDNHRTPLHHSAYPLSQLSVHQRQFTLCAVTTVDDILDLDIDLDNLQIGADAIELQITAQDTKQFGHSNPIHGVAEAFAKLRRATILPIVLTPRQRLGNSTQSSLSLVDLTDYCLRLAAEYCTIDLALKESDLINLIASKGRTKIIGHWHETEKPTRSWYDPHLISIYERAEQLGCDVVKITMPASSLEDNLSVPLFAQKVRASNVPTDVIAYNTGKCGRMSKCFGSPLIPVLPPNYRANGVENDDGLVTSKEIVSALFATFVYEPLRFFIYGASVDYSLSPAMHNAAYRASGMSHSFEAHSSSTLDDFQRFVREPNFGGAAVVQPYKTGVLHLLDALSPHARSIGSVNTIVPIRELINGAIPDDTTLLSQCNRAGPVKALYGYNTDWIGIRACLGRGLSPANTVRPQSTGLVCGAGGQARSAVYAMLSLGVTNIFLCNRTINHARALAKHYNDLINTNGIDELGAAVAAYSRVHVIDTFDAPWPEEHRQPTLIVSSIPTQDADGTAINFSIPNAWLKSPTGGVLVELAYRPVITRIVRQMRDESHKGWIFMDGFDILPELAFAQFELFTGRRAPGQLMRNEVVRAYEKQQSQYDSEPQNLDPNPAGE